MKIKDLTKKVETILRDFPQSRNSDQWLTLKIWATYYPQLIFQYQDRQAVLLKDVMELPREDNIKRIRAKFQNVQKMYLPTSLEVVKRRKQNEEEWKSLMGRGDTL
jgi:hypothetical protein